MLFINKKKLSLYLLTEKIQKVQNIMRGLSIEIFFSKHTNIFIVWKLIIKKNYSNYSVKTNGYGYY